LAEYRQHYDELTGQGVELAAISVDAPARSAPMKADLKLPFAVLSDSRRELITRWGLLNEKEMGGIAFPAVFLIDRDLTVRFRSVDKTAKRADSGEVTAIVKAVTQGASPKEAERRTLRPGLLFLRAAANAIRRGVRTRS
jgi:peroxiredoxin